VDVEPGAAFADEWMTRGATVLGLAVAGRLAAVYALQDSLKPGAARGDATPRIPPAGQPHAPLPRLRRFEPIRQGHCHEARHPPSRVFFPKCARSGRRPSSGSSRNRASVWRSLATASTTRRRSNRPTWGLPSAAPATLRGKRRDIILLNSEIEAVPESIALAQATLRTIKQNLFWAFFYNALSVPLAALGFLSPILCAAAMGVSDLIVIGNALRLRNWKWR